MEKETSPKEDRIRQVTHLYYSRPDVQKAIFEFAKHREISPRYFDGFGKRPDTFEYMGDVFQLVKRGATSFHCSEEIWDNALEIETGMSEKKLNELRIGWDLLIDIDCKWFEYSKLAAQSIITVMKNHGITNIGLKFSGSKGFHILVPWKAFPKELAGEETKNLFPSLPRNLVSYLRYKAEQEMKKIVPENFYEHFKNIDIKKGIKCNNCGEIAKQVEILVHNCPKCNREEIKKTNAEGKKDFLCPDCRVPLEINKEKSKLVSQCKNCKLNSLRNPEKFSKSIEVDLFELMGLDLVLVSPRHLFRMPYSLHEKTALASVVLDHDELKNFDMKKASPLGVKVKNFMPDSEEGEATEFVMQALDWGKEHEILRGEIKEEVSGKYANYKPVELINVQEDQFPPCIKNILKGVSDGRKRALTILINIFRHIGLSKEELEKRIYEWNGKNEVPLKEGYIISQLRWSYARKPRMPQNCKEYYQGIGVCDPDKFCSKLKNPLNYIVRKNFIANAPNFKNNKPQK